VRIWRGLTHNLSLKLASLGLALLLWVAVRADAPARIAIGGVPVEEPAQQLGVDPLADLAQHPADGLVNEVVLVVQEALRQPKGRPRIALLDVPEGREHRDPPVPHRGRGGELVKELGALGRALGKQVLGGGVDQVPVVHPLAPREVQVGDRLTLRRVRPLEALDQDRERHEAVLVDRALQEALAVGQRGVAVPARHAPLLGDRDAEEAVALAVAARLGAEEALRVGGALGIGERSQLALDRRDGAHHQMVDSTPSSSETGFV